MLCQAAGRLPLSTEANVFLQANPSTICRKQSANRNSFSLLISLICIKAAMIHTRLCLSPALFGSQLGY
jgi:hypothetical protein